jgi:hypothetical protein
LTFLPFSAICDHTIAENGRKSQHNLSTGQKKFRKVNLRWPLEIGKSVQL